MSRILPILYCLALACRPAVFQEADAQQIHQHFVAEQNAFYASEEESPLLPEDRARFEQLNFYSYDPSYCVQALWVRTPEEEPFEMPTSTERLPVYVKYGELHFAIAGRAMVLSAYQNVEYSQSDEGADYLFIPFNDLSNGETSYGGGRYMDFSIPQTDSVRLDLNNTYHPLCAYNPRYSCPIPPEENMLDVRIEAGVIYGINGEEGFDH